MRRTQHVSAWQVCWGAQEDGFRAQKHPDWWCVIQSLLLKPSGLWIGKPGENPETKVHSADLTDP